MCSFGVVRFMAPNNALSNAQERNDITHDPDDLLDSSVLCFRAIIAGATATSCFRMVFTRTAGQLRAAGNYPEYGKTMDGYFWTSITIFPLRMGQSIA